MSILEVQLVKRKVVKYGMIDGQRRYDLPEYRIYTGMLARCRNPNMKQYPRYGGRGISVCARWVEDFKNFYDDMGPRPTAKHSIDRINNDGNYEPGNCRWTTADVQARNKGSADRSSDYYWAERDLEILKRMWGQHYQVGEIAAALGRTAGSTRLRAHLIGLHRDASITKLCKKHPLLHPILRERGLDAFFAALKEHKEGAARERKNVISNANSARATAIAAIMSRESDRGDKMRALRRAGLNLSQIGKLFGVSRERVRQLQSLGFTEAKDRKVSSTKPENRAIHVARLFSVWNRASREARAEFLAAVTSVDDEKAAA